MPLNTALIADLAKKLLEAYSGPLGIVGVAGDLLLGEDDLADAITKLVEQGFLTNVLGADGKKIASPELIKLVIDKIKQIQLGTGILKADGILGERTLQWLNTRPFGHFNRDKSALPRSNKPVSPGDANHALRYFIEGDELPHIPSLAPLQTLTILTEAWLSWALVCNVNIKQTGNRDDANVIVGVEVLNQPANVVAIADVGPPGGAQLSLTFDRAETWTPHKLRATAAHEIGHLLGLHHIVAARQLMNDTLHDDISTPQSVDIAEAVRIWGPPPKLTF